MAKSEDAREGLCIGMGGTKDNKCQLRGPLEPGCLHAHYLPCHRKWKSTSQHIPFIRTSLKIKFVSEDGVPHICIYIYICIYVYIHHPFKHHRPTEPQPILAQANMCKSPKQNCIRTSLQVWVKTDLQQQVGSSCVPNNR